jgi:trehalose 2-sulfotransferase
VCGTPRSGTSLLCGLLASTGVAGRPEEYFWRGDEPFWSERWRVSGFAEYLRAAIAEGSTANGVFGAKVMWGYLPDLLGKLAALPGGRGLDDRSLLERPFQNLRCLWIWREDMVAQAVSWSKAIQTNVWSSADQRRPAATPPRFDFDQIHGLVAEAAAGRLGWERWFQAHAIEPLPIRYEDLVADKAGTTRSVLAFLGIAAAEHLPIQEPTAKQADALNHEWATRYRSMLAGRAATDPERWEPPGIGRLDQDRPAR